ncbi:hypothetical protein ABMA27_013899 [Loxostege sticticalis]|uniref:Uncharacterized protein n=1 Tax=Loxostege sticticalis TaxID=481309 RepID=A0ABR3IBX2_LOXSC
MAKPKKKATTEEKLAKDRLRKKEKYAEIKNDPEKYKIQKEKDRQKYLSRKEKKKILSIVDMSDRQKREQRRRWRKNSRKYLNKLKEQKKLENILLQNSPPDSETEENQNIAYPAERDPLMEIEETPKSIPNSGKTQGTPSAIRKMRYRSRKVISNLQKEIDKLKKEKDMLRKQLYTERKLQKVNKTIDTIEKKVDQVISDIKADKVEKVKKKLMFNEAINRGVSEKYKNLAKKEKRHFVKSIVDDSKLKKYRVLSKLNFAIKKKLPEKEVQKNKTAIIKRRVQDFLQEDENSQVAPGKNEYVKIGGSKKQKRYLTDNLKNLHMKYCAKWGRISYSIFCKYRPKWVDHPSGKRDTCQCKLHANINLLINSLKRAGIIKESTHTDVLKNLCCDIYNRKCLERKCQSCKNKVTRYLEFDNSKNIVFYEWIFEKQAYQGKDGKEKMKRVTLKKKKEDSPRNVIYKFETLMITFFKHTLNITVQHSVIKQLKENLSDNEVLCHIDFSENYLLKYNEEIQSFHFGGSRQQISLHTGVLYYLDGQSKEKSCKSFCTISKNINHDASAIWAHLEPILKLIQDLVPHLTTIHILSDSPSCQYRNRFIFYMMSKLNERIPNLKLISWNYSEAGHGKGAPDGIGAVVKRTADNHVKYGGDVATFEDFVQLVQQNIENVELIVIAEEEISKKKFPKDVPTFRGTTKVHQALWSSSLPFDIVFRNLSCFDCRDSYVPCTHGKHLGVLNVALCEQTTAPSTTRQNDDNIILESIESLTDETAEVAHEPLVVSLENSSMHIDSPTIFNNIGDLMQFDPIVETLMPCTNTSRVKILSNIPVNYQRFTKHDSNSHGFSSIDQIEFEKIMETKRNTQSYTINFLRKVPGKTVKFGWPVIGDDDVVPESHILQCLEKPVESRRGQFTFSYLPNLNIK